MQQSDYNLGTRLAEGAMFSAGIAYIVIPSDIDRSVYIAECYKTSTVSISSEHNGYSNRVPIDKMSLSLIEFPDNVNEFGSAVSFSIDPIRNHPIITGVHSTADDLGDLAEHQFKFGRKLESNVVEVVGSPKGRNLQLTVAADKAGEILLNARSKDESATVSIGVDGNFEVKALSNTEFTQYGVFNVTTFDRGDKDNFAEMEQSSDTHTFWDEHHNINTKSLKINDGKEPIILGNKWASFMKDFITEVSKITTTTSLGQMPILNSQQVLEYHDKVDQLLSTVGFIDK